MRVKNPEKRLASLWGRIDRQHNEQIAAQLRGSGCWTSAAATGLS